MSRNTRVGEGIDQPWIRSYALAPRRLSEGGWVWLGAYEWRWERPKAGLPNAINPPRISTRRATSARKAPRQR